MGQNSAIEWTDHTFNPWWGCAPVSRGCKHCYAETLANRFTAGLWGVRAERRLMGEANWRLPLRWDKAAANAGRPARVFCASMADVFDEHPKVVDERARLWDLIDRTPHLVWQLLTKRPQNIAGMIPWGTSWPSNVWLGASVESQDMADERLSILCSHPAAVRFVSAEPLVGPVTLRRWMYCAHMVATQMPGPGQVLRCDSCHQRYRYVPDPAGDIQITTGGIVTAHRRDVVGQAQLVDWVIAGGESGHGPHIAPAQPDWFRSLRDQCATHDVPYFLKQWGEWAPLTPGTSPGAEIRAYPGALMQRVGKAAAGAMLDGREHRAWPLLRADESW